MGKQVMEELQELIGRTELPIELPENAFLTKGERTRLVDMTAIINGLPSNVKEHIDLELTINNINDATFALPLKDGRYLFVKLKDRCIIGLEIAGKR